MTIGEEEKVSAWETETGLINDVNGWIAHPKFGQKDEYTTAIVATGAEGGNMFLVDLIDENGEIVASQGYSIGTGWIVSDDGQSISHPKRRNVVGSTVYGQLQNRVVKDLGVNMDQYGHPTEAKSWNGLGFHWMQEEHDTVSKEKRTAAMPTEFLGKKDVSAVATAPGAAPTTTVKVTPKGEVEEQLAGLVASSENVKAFQLAATKIPGVAQDDNLMANVLDDGPEGFYTKHKA